MPFVKCYRFSFIKRKGWSKLNLVVDQKLRCAAFHFRTVCFLRTVPITYRKGIHDGANRTTYNVGFVVGSVMCY